jgi:hypothetical protein
VTIAVVSKERATVPPQQKREPTRQAKREQTFDPAAIANKLAFTDEVAALGFREADVERFQVGFYRGRVYVPMRDADGSIAGFIGYADGVLKLPPKCRSRPPQTLCASRRPLDWSSDWASGKYRYLRPL